MHDRRAMTRRVPRSEWREDGVWQLPAGVQLCTDPSISLRYNSQHDSCRCTALNLCTAVDRSGGTAVQMSDYPMPYLCDASSCGVVFIVVECKLSVSCTAVSQETCHLTQVSRTTHGVSCHVLARCSLMYFLGPLQL